jgi:acetolactate synthase-1/2/3 large subunit
VARCCSGSACRSPSAGALRRGIEQTEAGRPVLLEFITSRELRVATNGSDTYLSPVPDNFR